MELPRKILIGHGVLSEFGEFLRNLDLNGKVLIVSGEHVKEIAGDRVEDSLISCGFDLSWYCVKEATIDEVNRVEEFAKGKGIDIIVGLGGGKSIDVAKLSASNMNLPFVSVPTSASHDGISSPFASIKGLNRPYSIISRPPIGILGDIEIIKNAPRRLLASGCGDLISKITAVKDWELARDLRGEYFGKYSASLARMSADIVIKESESIGKGSDESIRDVVEALISAGVAAGIAGSSRPCSGSEHLFSHALSIIAPNCGLHGEKCGIGTIMMAKLHEMDWEIVRKSLLNVHAPTSAVEIGVSE
ncbi:MAG: sn-glycerol-1-phosphate dehydrogenase, partial [Nitrososphaerales archaeon]|nr:sn-glycerol-1-phosphate dehydrogenase [Nitrososphaerales archaeon]